MSDKPQETVLAYTRYEWDCPWCSEVNTEESDPAGEVVECDGCSERTLVSETR